MKEGGLVSLVNLSVKMDGMGKDVSNTAAAVMVELASDTLESAFVDLAGLEQSVRL
ncbi:hypothetical protein chiPu_0027532, partial [Chiloscyllium punctatum]|nr:hypothetical protein [Chiloscyllium punctatum]